MDFIVLTGKGGKRMTDREKLIKILECCHEDDCGHCPACHTDGRLCDGATELSIPVPVFIYDDVLELLKEQEQTIKSATWVQHLYRLGSKRFECNWCHGTSWKPSDYCPDCGAKMDETVVNMDD